MAELWCVHVIGPDDVFAMPSLAMALKAAHRFNEAWLKRQDTTDPNYVLIWANVTQWMHDDEGHAADLQREHLVIDDILTPDERAEAIASLLPGLTA